tara:strand:- start:4185 stop:4652 length:468 start_codon:yes stop_codon:yes gene_type:complete
MSAFTLIYTRAARVYPSNTVNIPYPNLVLSGVTTSLGTNLLVDNTLDFLALGIKVGDTVFNPTDETYALVVQVTATELKLTSDIFTTSPEDYLIYQGVNNGCYIYVPAQEAGFILDVETIGGDQVIFNDPPAGVLPVQVKKVLRDTTATNLVALW